MQQLNSKNFISKNFLLYSKEAEILYHEYAKDMPIIDYHNHLSPKQIAEDLPIDIEIESYRSIIKEFLSFLNEPASPHDPSFYQHNEVGTLLEL